MDTYVKICTLTAVSVVLCVLLRDTQKPVSALLSMFVCAGILGLGASFLKPIFEVIQKLQKISSFSDELIKPLFKVVGISLLSSIMKGICADAGETALGKALEITGMLLCVYATLPLILAVFELVEKLIGGGT